MSTQDAKAPEVSAPAVDDGLHVTGKASRRRVPFPAWLVRDSNLGFVLTRCEVRELFPVTMTARIGINGLETFASFAQLASTDEIAQARVAALMRKNALVQTAANA